MAEANNVPLRAYADPLSRVDWLERYIALHHGQFRLTLRAVLIYLAACTLAVVLNLIGMRPINILVGATFQIIALIGLTAWGNIVATWLFGFISGQPGGEKGLSFKDGFDKGTAFLKGYFRFVGYVALYGALPFMLLGIISVWDDPIGALVLIGLSISLAIAGALYFEKARFFLYLVWTVYLAIYLWILAGFIPGLREIKVKMSEVGGGFVTTRIVDNPADEAKKKAEAKQREARIEVAKNCYNALPDKPKPADKAECDELHQKIDTPLFGGVVEAASSVKDSAAGALNQGVDTGRKLFPGKEVVWEGTYIPSQHQGPMSIGVVKAGVYRLEGEGLRQQVDPNSPNLRTHNWRGEVVSEGGRCVIVIPRPEEMSIPFTGAGQCYGAVIMLSAGNRRHWVADGGCFEHPGDEALVDLNNGAHPHRYRGAGSHKLRLIKC